MKGIAFGFSRDCLPNLVYYVKLFSSFPSLSILTFGKKYLSNKNIWSVKHRMKLTWSDIIERHGKFEVSFGVPGCGQIRQLVLWGQYQGSHFKAGHTVEGQYLKENIKKYSHITGNLDLNERPSFQKAWNKVFELSIIVPHTRKSLVKGERFIRSVRKTWVIDSCTNVGSNTQY